MGKQFGNLIRARHIITYILSPYEQRLFAGFFSQGVPNMVRRVSEEVPYMLPSAIICSMVYYFGTKNYHKRMRKNPADFVNDE